MDRFLKDHFAAILAKDAAAALAGYAPGAVGILHLDGTSRVLSGAALARALCDLVSPGVLGGKRRLRVLEERTGGNYGVLALSSEGFTPFLCYTCIVKNEKIAYMTLYAHRPAFQLLLAEEDRRVPRGKAAKRLFYKHAAAMMSVNADVIVRDYAPDAVVITNLAGETCTGRPEIRAFCASLMKSVGKIVKGFRFHGFHALRWSTRDAAQGLLLFVGEAGSLGTIMTETYWVQDGKIKFEASVCSGEMLELVKRAVGE